MATTPDDVLAKRPVDEARVAAHRRRMLAQMRAYWLRELRGSAGLTQAQVAERIGVGRRQVSTIENGDIENAKIGTSRRYLEAVSTLAVDYVIGDERVQVA